MEKELKRIGKNMATASTSLRQSSLKGLESSDAVPAQCFISLQILPNILEFMAVSVKILDHISALKLNRC